MEGGCERDAASWPAKAGRFVAARDEASPAADDLFLLRLQPDRLDDQPADPRLFFALSNFLTATAACPARRQGGAGGRQVPRHRSLPARAADQAHPLQDAVLWPRRHAVSDHRAASSISPSTTMASASRFDEAVEAFTWHRFAAIQIWLFTCFLLYVTASGGFRGARTGQAEAADVRSALMRAWHGSCCPPVDREEIDERTAVLHGAGRADACRAVQPRRRGRRLVLRHRPDADRSARRFQAAAARHRRPDRARDGEPQDRACRA